MGSHLDSTKIYSSPLLILLYSCHSPLPLHIFDPIYQISLDLPFQLENLIPFLSCSSIWNPSVSCFLPLLMPRSCCCYCFGYLWFSPSVSLQPHHPHNKKDGVSRSHRSMTPFLKVTKFLQINHKSFCHFSS
jgi:hypothetical protein